MISVEHPMTQEINVHINLSFPARSARQRDPREGKPTSTAVAHSQSEVPFPSRSFAALGRE
jgi:hypothetical protein